MELKWTALLLHSLFKQSNSLYVTLYVFSIVYDESACSRQTVIELVRTSFLVTGLLLESIFLSVPFSPRRDQRSSSP